MADPGPSTVSISNISALFLTHFDDIKGQTTIFYESDGIPQDDIEHSTLPSGLHLLDSDVILFRHATLPGVGVFRSKAVEGGRGRKMGTLGVILAEDLPDQIFELQSPLNALWDELERLGSPYSVTPSDGGAEHPIGKRLEEVWRNRGSVSSSSKMKGKDVDRVRRLVDGRLSVKSSHPITYLPSLLSILGPQLIPIYKASMTHKRILIYSLPPLLPLGAFAWCIWAMGIAPRHIQSSSRPNSAESDPIDPETACSWLGNVGLMDLASLKSQSGGWVATTSDAIFRSHRVYDIFLDLSSSPPSLHYPPASGSSSIGQSISYSLSDLPLYRSLLLLDTSPPGITILPTSDTVDDEDDGEDEAEHDHDDEGLTVRRGGYTRLKTGPKGRSSIYSRPGGWWLLAFDMFNRAWQLCVGVCEYATGRGRVGEIALKDGEEDAAPLLAGRDLVPPRAHIHGLDSNPEEQEDEQDDGVGEEVEDEAVRRGRLMLRQLHHHSYHLFIRLRQVVGSTSQRSDGLSEKEVKELVGGKIWGGAGEAKFWQELSVALGFAEKA